MINFDIPFKIRISPLFNNFWIDILLYALIPFIILYQFIAPRIVKNLLKYDISVARSEVDETKKLVREMFPKRR